MNPKDIAKLLSEDVRDNNGLNARPPEPEKVPTPDDIAAEVPEDPRLSSFLAKNEQLKAPKSGYIIHLESGGVIEANYAKLVGGMVYFFFGPPEAGLRCGGCSAAAAERCPEAYKVRWVQTPNTVGGPAAQVTRDSKRFIEMSPEENRAWAQQEMAAGRKTRGRAHVELPFGRCRTIPGDKVAQPGIVKN